MRKPILCVDFDGVLHSYTSGWTSLNNIRDPPVPGAMDFLREAVNHFRVMIYSSRSRDVTGIAAMRDWLLRYAEEEHSYFAWVHQIEWPTEKPAAFVSLDDRALTFTGTFPDMETLLNFKPWNKP